MTCRKNLTAELAALEAQFPRDGKRFWRSLEELGETEAFQDLMRREFPDQASVWPNAVSRREFLTLMSASLALAGISGCSVKPAPSTDLVPYVKPPEEVVPGRPLFFATAMAINEGAVGLLVESHMGRPTKIEGNPDHPASLGATSAMHQASVLTLYDPDRSRTVTHFGRESTWDRATAAIQQEISKQRGKRGTGLRILTGNVVSPTLTAQLEDLLKELPAARWHTYEPIHRDTACRASEIAFGEVVDAVYDFRKADVVLSLDADFLGVGPAQLRYAADFMGRRRVRTTEREAARAEMNRLYVVEAAVSCTGAKADHRLPLPAGKIAGLASALANELGVGAGDAAPAGHDKWVAAVA
ncbi:MAG TPA: TAT-variant-translocated molybdopterin oxidoreductase, partial [Pirellulales bacterium]|nr:TAT-variant-translocated molybdopterin oxidoreductase [Pirellulales bacterium]